MVGEHEFGSRRWLEIPAIRTLSQRKQWVCWKSQQRNGKQTKIPYQPSGKVASSTDSRTWSEMSECFSAVIAGKFDGIGFALAPDDGLTGIDLDHCINQDGTLEPWAWEIVGQIASYTEISPGGDGLHIWCLADPDFTGRRKGPIEIYTQGRYLTVTAVLWRNTSLNIVEPITPIEKIVAEFIGEEPPQNTTLDHELPFLIDEQAEPPAAHFAALLANSKIFQQSWEHTRKDLSDQSLSSYDMSLATIAVYADWDDQDIVNLIIAHRRMNGSLAKGIRSDYLKRTLSRAKDAPSHGFKDYEAAEMHHVEEAREGAPEEALSELSTRLGMTIHKVIQRGRDPAFYYLDSEHGEIFLGGQENVLSQAKVRAAVIGKSQLLLPRLKTLQWDRVVQLMVQSSVVEELGEGQRSDETRAWLGGYYNDKPRSEPETREQMATVLRAGDESFLWEGQSYFRINDFKKWLFKVLGEKCPTAYLCSRLREVGLSPEQFSVRSGDKTLKARVWTDKIVKAPEPTDS